MYIIGFGIQGFCFCFVVCFFGGGFWGVFIFQYYSYSFTFLHFLPHFLVFLNQDRKGQMSCVLVPWAFSRGPGSRMICYPALIIESAFSHSQRSPVWTVHFRSSWQGDPELGKKAGPSTLHSSVVWEVHSQTDLILPDPVPILGRIH